MYAVLPSSLHLVRKLHKYKALVHADPKLTINASELNTRSSRLHLTYYYQFLLFLLHRTAMGYNSSWFKPGWPTQFAITCNCFQAFLLYATKHAIVIQSMLANRLQPDSVMIKEFWEAFNQMLTSSTSLGIPTLRNSELSVRDR
jgi:hypothetical protein